MSELLKLIDLKADTPIERAFVGCLHRYKIPFDAQMSLLDNIVTYSVKNAEDLPRAKQMLYHVLHPREIGR